MTNKTMLGMKLFRERDDTSYDVQRIVKIYSDPDKVMIEDEWTEERKKVSLKEIAKDYSILESKAILMFSIVNLNMKDGSVSHDVVVSMVKKMDMAMETFSPCVICRQSVTDFFYNILSQKEEHEYVGVSVSDKTCPPNIEYGELLMCDGIEYSQVVNIYLDDTIESVLKCVNVCKFDEVLSTLYNKYADAKKNQILKMKQTDHGWCKNLKTLLTINNFWLDVDAAFNITNVDFDISHHTIVKRDENGKSYDSLDPDCARFLSGLWFSESDTKRMNISDSIITDYYYDIDLGEYRNENYVLIRDKWENLYLLVYTVDGEYFEADLAAEKEELSHKFGLKIVDKYLGDK